MRSALVTGAGGFVGNALVKGLSERGITTWAVIRPGGDTRCFKNMDNVNIVECDLRNYKSLAGLFLPNTEIEVFYHFAWAGTSGRNRVNETLQLVNAGASCEAVKQAAILKSKKFVFAASIMEYEILKAKDTSIFPASYLYGVGKLAADKMCSIIAAEKGITYIATILSNIYGPGELSERFLNSTLIQMIAGNPISLSTCMQDYDFLYVEDAVAALIAIGDAPDGKGSYYIGNSQARLLKEYVLEMHQIANSNSQLKFGDRGCVANTGIYSQLDMARVERELGVVPEVSFRNGVFRTMEWLKNKEEHNE